MVRKKQGKKFREEFITAEKNTTGRRILRGSGAEWLFFWRGYCYLDPVRFVSSSKYRMTKGVVRKTRKRESRW